MGDLEQMLIDRRGLQWLRAGSRVCLGPCPKLNTFSSVLCSKKGKRKRITINAEDSSFGEGEKKES
jgi:hypothetical protein